MTTTRRTLTTVSGTVAALILAVGLGACGSTEGSAARPGPTPVHARATASTGAGADANAARATSVDPGGSDVVAIGGLEGDATRQSPEGTGEAAAPSSTTDTTTAPTDPATTARTVGRTPRGSGLAGPSDLHGRVTDQVAAHQVTGGATGDGPADDAECDAAAAAIELFQDMAADAYRNDERGKVSELMAAAAATEDRATDRGCFFIWG